MGFISPSCPKAEKKKKKKIVNKDIGEKKKKVDTLTGMGGNENLSIYASHVETLIKGSRHIFQMKPDPGSSNCKSGSKSTTTASNSS